MSSSSISSSGGVMSSKKPPGLVLPTISVNSVNTSQDEPCPMIYEQGPSHPSSPTIPVTQDTITADLMHRIQMFSSQFDSARLSPNYATSDLGSSARSSFSTASWMAYRERSMDFDKELISPFDCDTACSVSPSFSLSPNSVNHFTFDARSVSSLGHSSSSNLNNLLAVGAYELSRERSRSESDMQPTLDEARLLGNSTISVPCYNTKKSKFDVKRSSSTPPPTANERELLERPTTGLENKEDLNAANAIVHNWANHQIFALQNATSMYNLLTASQSALSTCGSTEDCSIAAPAAVKGVPIKDEERSKQMQYKCTLCGQAFAVHDRLAKHIASRHRQRSCTLDDAAKVHKCNMCTKCFSRSDMLTRHMRLHTGSKPYSCPTCSQVFSRSDHLSTHLRTHTGEKPYACPLCSYSASRRDMISRHMRTHALTDDVTMPISQLSIRSATTSPLPPKISSTVVEIGSGELSAFKPILSNSNHLSVAPFQSMSISTPPSPSFAPPVVLNRQSSFDNSVT